MNNGICLRGSKNTLAALKRVSRNKDNGWDMFQIRSANRHGTWTYGSKKALLATFELQLHSSQPSEFNVKLSRCS